jgi:glycosyltransferase involved in cell wall biosynthesis
MNLHQTPETTASHETPADRALPAGVSVVVPCFQSEETLVALVEQLSAVLPNCSERYEAILVNDGSSDSTWELIQALAGRYPWVRGICLMRNYGQHNATLCGARAARYDVTVTLDDDLQNPPSEIPIVLAKLAEGYDVVYGAAQGKTHSLYRYALSWLMRLAVAIATRQRTVRDLSALRAFRTSVRLAFRDYRSPNLLFDVLLGWGTTSIATVAVKHDIRRKGQSNYGFWSLVNAALLLWTGYTTAPLRFASLIGFGFVLFGIVTLGYVLFIYITQGSLPGFPFLASTIVIFGGAQLFTLGIIGEYLARMFNRSLDRPVYVVKIEVDGARDQS